MEDEILDYSGYRGHATKVGKLLYDVVRAREGSADDLAMAFALANEADLPAAVIKAAPLARVHFPEDPRIPFQLAKARFERATATDDRRLELDLEAAEHLLQRLPPERRPAGLAEDIAQMRRDMEMDIGGTPINELFRRFADAMKGELDL
jgi:hypothetical protein